MLMELKATLDVKGSETRSCDHYVFGKLGSAVSGGVYIQKCMNEPPDELVITFKKVGDNDANC
jgi:hypothetical protein